MKNTKTTWFPHVLLANFRKFVGLSHDQFTVSHIFMGRSYDLLQLANFTSIQSILKILKKRPINRENNKKL